MFIEKPFLKPRGPSIWSFSSYLSQLTIKVLAIHRKHPECTQRNWREHEEQRLFVTTKLDSRWQHEFLFSVKIVSSLPFVTLFVSSPQIGQCSQILASHWSILVIAKHTNWDPLWLKSANESHKRMIFQLLCKTARQLNAYHNKNWVFFLELNIAMVV